MKQPALNTIVNITNFHFEQHGEDAPQPVLDKIDSGDYCLTRVTPNGDTFIAIIDQHNGEFIDTVKPAGEPQPYES